MSARQEELGRRLAEISAQVMTLGLRVEELESQLAFDGRVIAALREDRDRLQAQTKELEEDLAAEQLAVADATDRLSKQRLEQRALVEDLVKTQSTLQARSDQLQRMMRSRWFRVARSAWRVRRQRPPLVSMLLIAAALAGGAFVVLDAPDAGTVVAALLSVSILVAAAIAYAVIVPALRDRRVPRMAGESSFARSLDAPQGDVTAESAAASEGGGVIPPTAIATQPARTEAQGRIRLVPAAPGASELDDERERWLAGARASGIRQLRVAGILDEMSQASFAPECELFTAFTANDWRERLEARPPHMLLVESAWSGNAGGWQYCVASYGHPRYAGLPFLRELIEWCRELGIPTVFWNKEDPVHFDRFKEAAALFDHVFTSDSNQIPHYEALNSAEIKTIDSLSFAAQPRLHNPIPLVRRRMPQPVFAGTYYRDRHPDRQRSLEAILDAARPHGLVIYDRMFGTDSEAYGFPDRFLPHVKGRLSYAETVDAYKRHSVFLNVNSVTDSPTMFSRRVFELLACGTAVLSTPSAGMEAMFGDLVPVAEMEAEAAATLQRLSEDDAYRRDLTRRAQRFVLAEHTYRDRLLQIARTVGFDFDENTGEETAALAVANEADELASLSKALLAQSTPPDEVLFGLSNGVLTDHDLEQLAKRLSSSLIRVVKQPLDHSHSERMRELAALAATPWVAPLNPSVSYDEDHLRHLVACTRFADAQVVGCAEETPERASTHRYDEAVSPDTAIASREVVAKRGWPEDSGEMRRWFAQGVRIYAAESGHEPAST